MEDWQIDFEWLQIRHYVKKALKHEELPKLDVVLLLVGIQESGIIKNSYTKEEKQDLMHVAVCELLTEDGIYEFLGRDDEGWPHYKQMRPLQSGNLKAQELLLKQKLIRYFNLSQTNQKSDL